MEAKDTVIRASEVMEALESAEGTLPKANAVLDYMSPKIDGIFAEGKKAGRKSMLKDIKDGKEDIDDIIDSLCQKAIMAALNDGKQAGIKEVVEEITKLAIASGDLNLQGYVVGLLEQLSKHD